jgi:hypothetical protein
MRRDLDPRRVADVRDQASRRVRRLTVGLVAGATALTAVFAGIAAASSHTTKRIVQTTSQRTRHAAAPTRTVTAPTPSLVPSGNGSSTPSQAPAQQQAPAVTPSAAPPVAVTGGS